MVIEWKDIKNNGNKVVESWLSDADKRNLCMVEKGWGQTATDIAECIGSMRERSQFKNMVGIIDGEPACAIMFGISRGVLYLYNIVVNPECRGQGITGNVISQLLSRIGTFEMGDPYDKVLISIIPENKIMHRILNGLGFVNQGFDGEYDVFENSRTEDLSQSF